MALMCNAYCVLAAAWRGCAGWLKRVICAVCCAE